MELILLRDKITSTDISGQLIIAGNRECFTLERPLTSPNLTGAVAIPKGRYRVHFSVSPRAKAGTLWTPDPHGRLLELQDVPSRSEILFHAGNTVADTIGCILVGTTRALTGTRTLPGRFTSSIASSRDALTALMAKYNEPCYLTIVVP
jgi:hypothetical protein